MGRKAPDGSQDGGFGHAGQAGKHRDEVVVIAEAAGLGDLAD